MIQGDFSEVAKFYHHRPSYSPILIKNILKFSGLKDDFSVADVGAGTGKLTEVLRQVAPEMKVISVEPNDSMRAIGEKTLLDITWLKGSAEKTNLNDDSVDLLFMASSFHWSDPSRSLPEFKRVLKSGGYFCALWNPRHIEAGSIFEEIENEIKIIIPDLKRVSSATQTDKNWFEILQSTGDFKEVFSLSIPYFETMSKERYMGIWRSVNDIQSQAGGGMSGLKS